MSQDTVLFPGERQTITRTILLVEDDPDLGLFLAEALEQEVPYRVIVATNSHAALQLVQHVTPDLLLIDYGLPGMNGITLYDHMRTNPALASIPAILLTASRYLPQEQLSERQLLIIEKPFDLETLLATINTLLASHHSGL